MKKNPVAFLRLVSLIEGVSFLVLVGIAMPLKYGANIPEAVRIAGSIHGGLFILFGMALLRVLFAARWPASRTGLVFVASLVPFAPFWIDRRMRFWQEEHARKSAEDAF